MYWQDESDIAGAVLHLTQACRQICIHALLMRNKSPTIRKDGFWSRSPDTVVPHCIYKWGLDRLHSGTWLCWWDQQSWIKWSAGYKPSRWDLEISWSSADAEDPPWRRPETEPDFSVHPGKFPESVYLPKPATYKPRVNSYKFTRGTPPQFYTSVSIKGRVSWWKTEPQDPHRAQRADNRSVEFLHVWCTFVPHVPAGLQAELHQRSDDELVYVTRHQLPFALLVQNLHYLRARLDGKMKTACKLQNQLMSWRQDDQRGTVPSSSPACWFRH